MRTAIMISCLATFVALPAVSQPVCPNDEPCEIKTMPAVCKIYSGALSFRSSKGSDQVGVVMQQWQIANGEVVEIPHQGLLIVHLRAGALFTGNGADRKQWREDSFWSVPASEQLIIHTTRNSVVLQTVDFITQ